MRVAFQGELGAFSEEALHTFFPGSEPVPIAAFESVFEALTERRVERAVVPIENSLFGSVHVNYDLLRIHDVVITGELNLRIRHHLMALPGVRLEDVRRVVSHPQALGQCQDFLRRTLPEARIEPVYDTAGAAKDVARSGSRETAAIASRHAATRYGLDVLAPEIESDSRNYTRFLALSRHEDAPGVPDVPEKEYRTSIVYALKENVPGSLFRSLAVFSLRDINLYKIESRPLIGSPGNYLFYLDLAGSERNERVRRALDHLAEMTVFQKVLGSYERGPFIG